jgi:hypothetical protein
MVLAERAAALRKQVLPRHLSRALRLSPQLGKQAINGIKSAREKGRQLTRPLSFRV